MDRLPGFLINTLQRFNVLKAKKKIPKPKKVNQLIKSGLPSKLKNGLEFLITLSEKEDEISVSKRVEAIREEIASKGNQKVPIWYSPKPGSSGTSAEDDIKPKPGKELFFTFEQIAKTGKNKKWGTFLYILARDFSANNVLEFGSCAGISAGYLYLAPSIKKLITVEGSLELSKIAEKTLKILSNDQKKFIVINDTFDNVIDNYLNDQGKFDMVFIDGHHEKIATIHYFQRIRPYLADKALVIFDDISWSYDMRECWDENLSKREEFEHTIDLGDIGLCFFNSQGNFNPKKWDLRFFTGRYTIGEPHGWKIS